jgi:hypothetical protein
VTKALRLQWHHVAGCCWGPTMSKSEAEKAERNRHSTARLTNRARSPRGAEHLPAGSGGSVMKEWPADHVPNATNALSGTHIRERSRILSCMRATGLSPRLACQPMERWPKQECDLALRLCGRVAILDRSSEMHLKRPLEMVRSLRTAHKFV